MEAPPPTDLTALAPAEAYRRALEIPDSWDLYEEAHKILNAHLSNDPAAALALFATIEPSLRSILSVGREYEWADDDPERSARLLIEHLPPGSRFRNNALNGIIRRWGQTDPAAAIRLIEELDPEGRHHLNLSGRLEWDADKTLAALEDVADTTLRARLAEPILAKTAPGDLTKALAWIDSHLAGEARTRAANAVVVSLAKEDFAAAAPFIGDLGDAFRFSDAGSQFEEWVKHDFDAARAWAESLPDGKTHLRAMATVLESWPASDRGTAWTLAIALPEGRTRSVTTARILREWAATDLAALRDWSGSLPEGPDKQTARNVILDRMIDDDPIATADFIASAPSSEVSDRNGTSLSPIVGKQSLIFWRS